MLSELLHDPYPVIAFFSLIEGPMIAIAAGVGYAVIRINPLISFAIILGGAFVQDVVYYWLGGWAARVEKIRAFATKTKLLRENLLTLEVSWRKSMFLTLLLSKFAYGLYAPFVVSAGVSKAPFLKFLAISMALSAPVIAMWMGIGYGFARLYGASGHWADFVVTGVGVAGLVVLFFVMRHARRRLDPKQARRKSRFIEHQGGAKAKG